MSSGLLCNTDMSASNVTMQYSRRRTTDLSDKLCASVWVVEPIELIKLN